MCKIETNTVFYRLDALHGERRDRSVLFWDSMPVSDLTTVLAKKVADMRRQRNLSARRGSLTFPNNRSGTGNLMGDH